MAEREGFCPPHPTFSFYINKLATTYVYLYYNYRSV
jgi:hypothetical protein